MNAVLALTRTTAGAIFLQIIVGGLVTFDYIAAPIHIAIGILVFVIAVLSMISAFAKHSFRQVKIMTLLTVALLVAQIILGFVALRNGSQLIAEIHLVNAVLLYGLAVSVSVTAMRMNHSLKVKSGEAMSNESAKQ